MDSNVTWMFTERPAILVIFPSLLRTVVCCSFQGALSPLVGSWPQLVAPFLGLITCFGYAYPNRSYAGSRCCALCTGGRGCTSQSWTPWVRVPKRPILCLPTSLLSIWSLWGSTHPHRHEVKEGDKERLPVPSLRSTKHERWKEPSMSRRTEVSTVLRDVLNERARMRARETGLIKRERACDGADVAQRLIFGWWQEPAMALEGRCQIVGRRERSLTASGLSQRFPRSGGSVPPSVGRTGSLTAFGGGSHLVFVVAALSGSDPGRPLGDGSAKRTGRDLEGRGRQRQRQPGRHHAGRAMGCTEWSARRSSTDQWQQHRRKCPFPAAEIPAGALSLADLGVFGRDRLGDLPRRPQEVKGDVLTRLFQRVSLWLRSGHRLGASGDVACSDGRGQRAGGASWQTGTLAHEAPCDEVPKEVAEQRRERIRSEAQDHGCPVSEEAQDLAGGLIVLTHAPRCLLSGPEVIVCARLRWQIERLFRLWKQEGKKDEWRSKKPDHIMTERSAKVCAMVMHPWLRHQGCWQDEQRSLCKAAPLVRPEIHRLRIALVEGRVRSVLRALIAQLRPFGGRLTRRNAHPGTDQLLAEGLDWPVPFFTSCLWGLHIPLPPSPPPGTRTQMAHLSALRFYAS